MGGVLNVKFLTHPLPATHPLTVGLEKSYLKNFVPP